MDKLKFNVTFHRKRYQVFIEMGVAHKFKNKNQANDFIKKFRNVIHDNVLVLGNCYSQLQTIKQHYYNFFNGETKRHLKSACRDFEQSYHWIYGNYCDHPHVQFTQIRVSFDNIIDIMNTLKKDAQRNKRRVLLSQLYPIEKIIYLILDTYTKNINGLTDGVSYRTEEIKLKPFNDGNTSKKTLRKPKAS